MRVVSQPERAIVSLRASVVAGPTIAGLFYYLADGGFRSVAVRYFDDETGGWSHRVLGTHQSAINQIVGLLDSAYPIVGRSSFLTRRVSFATVDDKSPLQDSIGYFRASGGQLKLDDVPNFSNIFVRRHMLYKVEEENGGVKLVSIGGVFPKSIQDFLYSAIGRDVRYRPDVLYGVECAKAYLTVAETGEPGCFEVDAISKWGTQEQLIRRRYRRVIFPFNDEAGQKWVLVFRL